MNTCFKSKKVRSKKLTNAARGQNCTLQTPVCKNRRDTVVLCHAPSEDKGVSTKSPDFWAADGCFDCHKYLDGNECSQAEARFYWMRGIYKTLKRRFTDNVITIN